MLIPALAIRLLSALALAWMAGLIWFIVAEPGPAPIGQRTDAVVVLTGGPGRIPRAIDVLNGGSARLMLVSGVNPVVSADQFIRSSNLDPALLICCVVLGREATTTRGNAREVADFARRHRVRSIRLVTAGYHMQRAHAEVAAALPADVALLADAVAAPLPPWSLISEYNKLIAVHALLLTGIAR